MNVNERNTPVKPASPFPKLHLTGQQNLGRQPNNTSLEWSPSSTPVTIEAKLSSNRIMSAACLDTSEPAIPMATPEKHSTQDKSKLSQKNIAALQCESMDTNNPPISAFFKAGESLTPSPVTATMAPWRWHPSTIMSFCCGDVLANTISVCSLNISSSFSMEISCNDIEQTRKHRRAQNFKYQSLPILLL